MPRTYGKAKKQTRLSFNPVASFQDLENGPDEKPDRRANVRYAHPSMSTIRTERPKVNNHQGDKRQKSPAPPAQDTKPVVESPPKVKRSSRRKSRAKESEPRPVQRSSSSEPVIIVNDQSESDLEIMSSARKISGKQRLKRKRSSTSSEEMENLPSQNSPETRAPEDSDADEIVTQPRRRLRRRGEPSKPTVVLDDSDDDLVISSPAKKRRRNMGPDVPQTPRRGSDQDKLDLEEDLEDLQDSVVRDTRTRGRLANSARAQRQQHLEALRRRRAGEKTEDASQSESEAAESGSEENENESETSIKQPQFRNEAEDSDVESAIASNEDLDRYEDDFVLDDGKDTLGVPAGAEDMPFEFTRHAYKQTKEYFQDAVEWMVHNQLNPAFPRDDTLYRVAFAKVEDEVKGRTGSQLMSSAWNVDFRRALLARPQIEVTIYPTSENHPCDACNRSGHPASSDIKLYGKAYSLETLEPLSDDDESGDDDAQNENDTEELDRDGNPLPSEDTRFFLGRHCKVKATMAHTLTHWRFHLNEWVTDYLDRMGYLADDEILKRSHWSQKRKAKYAAETVGMMVQTGEVHKLWRDFHINLKAARDQTALRW